MLENQLKAFAFSRSAPVIFPLNTLILSQHDKTLLYYEWP